MRNAWGASIEAPVQSVSWQEVRSNPNLNPNWSWHEVRSNREASDPKKGGQGTSKKLEKAFLKAAEGPSFGVRDLPEEVVPFGLGFGLGLR